MADNKYSGMTVNERLYVSGYIKEFDKAVKDNDTEKVKEVLKKVDLTEELIEPILSQLNL